MTNRASARLVLWVAIVTLLGANAAALSNLDSPKARPDRRSAATTTTSTTALPEPPRILFGRRPPTTEIYSVVSARLDGSAPEPSTNPAVRTDQVRNGRTVISRVLSQDGSQFSGCGVAGCSSGYRTRTEAGLILGRHPAAAETTLSSGGHDIEPVFHRDGRIFYLRLQERAGTPENQVRAVAVMNQRGDIVDSFVPALEHSYYGFALSPDGTQLAVVRYSQNAPGAEPGAAGVFVIDLRDRSERLLAEGDYGDLAWSNDGTRLAATSLAYAVPRGRAYQPGDHPIGEDIWILPLDGSPVRQLTRLADPSVYGQLCSGAGSPLVDIRSPMWSPDDSMIAVVTNHRHLARMGRDFDIGVVDANTGETRVVYAVPPIQCRRIDGNNTAIEITELVELYGWAS